MAWVSTTLRFRHSSAITVAAIIMMIAGLSVARWQPYLLILLFIPFAVAVWSWRAGTDIDADGITVRAAIGRRRISWTAVAALRLDEKKQVEAVLTSGHRVALPAVPGKDLPDVLRAAGKELLTTENGQ
jgi:hypothetical protein